MQKILLGGTIKAINVFKKDTDRIASSILKLYTFNCEPAEMSWGG